jgi:hypothetical protein
LFGYFRISDPPADTDEARGGDVEIELADELVALAFVHELQLPLVLLRLHFRRPPGLGC